MELKLEKVTIGYRGDEALCSDINVSANSGEAVALIGSNGTGKSTLLRSIAALAKIREGVITLDGKLISAMPSHCRATTLAMVTTESINAAYTTVRQIIELGRVPYSGWAGKLSPEDIEVVDRAMESTKSTEFAKRTIDTLSDGQRQRVMLARAIAQTTPLLLLDEPTAFLDPENREMIISLIEELATKTNKIIIYSTHEVELARGATTCRWVMKDRKLSVEN